MKKSRINRNLAGEIVLRPPLFYCYLPYSQTSNINSQTKKHYVILLYFELENDNYRRYFMGAIPHTSCSIYRSWLPLSTHLSDLQEGAEFIIGVA